MTETREPSATATSCERSETRESSVTRTTSCEQSETIAVPRPHVPYGPKSIPSWKTDADYLDHAAASIEGGFLAGGSNVTATVVKLIRDAAAAIRKASSCGALNPHPHRERGNIFEHAACTLDAEHGGSHCDSNGVPFLTAPEADSGVLRNHQDENYFVVDCELCLAWLREASDVDALEAARRIAVADGLAGTTISPDLMTQYLAVAKDALARIRPDATCKEGCRHACPVCRMGLVTHLPCDPRCELNSAARA